MRRRLHASYSLVPIIFYIWRFQWGRQGRPGRGQLLQQQRERAAGQWQRDLPGGGELRGGHGSFSVAVGDFNGDGKADLAVANCERQQRERAAGQWRRDLPGGGELRRRVFSLSPWRSGTSTGTASPTWRWQMRAAT